MKVYLDNNVLDNVFRKSDLKDVNYGSLWCVKNDEVIDKRTYPDDMNLSFIMKSPLGHQATFFKTDIVLSHPYKEKFNISADRALFMELYISGFQFKYINIPIVYFYLGGIGSNIKTLAERQKQFHDIKREFFSEQVVCDIEKMIKVEEEFSFVHRVMVLHILYKFFKYIQRIRSKFLYG